MLQPSLEGLFWSNYLNQLKLLNPIEKAQKGRPETGQQAESKFAAIPQLGYRVKEIMNLI